MHSFNAFKKYRFMPKPPKLLRRFKNEDNGATAIEFAIVAGPFFLLVFAILETSMYFFASQYLESSIDTVARKIRTGQLQHISTAEDFKKEVCKEIVALLDCDGKLKVRVETAGKFKDLTDPPSPKETPPGSGNYEYDDADFTYSQPGSVEIAQVTAVYPWPIYTNYSAPLATNGAKTEAIINATAVIRTEPF